jgi:hypothetical protein
MNIVPAAATGTTQPAYGYGYTSYGNTANLTGVLQLNQAVQQNIMYQMGYNTYGTGYPNQYPGYTAPGYPTYGGYPTTMIPQQAQTPVCVSGIAIDSGHNNYALYNTRVYLYFGGAGVAGAPTQYTSQRYYTVFP